MAGILPQRYFLPPKTQGPLLTLSLLINVGVRFSRIHPGCHVVFAKLDLQYNLCAFQSDL